MSKYISSSDTFNDIAIFLHYFPLSFSLFGWFASSTLLHPFFPPVCPPLNLYLASFVLICIFIFNVLRRCFVFMLISVVCVIAIFPVLFTVVFIGKLEYIVLNMNIHKCMHPWYYVIQRPVFVSLEQTFLKTCVLACQALYFIDTCLSMKFQPFKWCQINPQFLQPICNLPP